MLAGGPSRIFEYFAVSKGVEARPSHFVVLSLAWGWSLDRMAPDRFDLLGAALCVAGVAVIMYTPR